MWKGFIRNHIRENRGSSLSVRIAAFVAAFFLVLLCCTLYNVWHYDVVRCQTENGNYHARLTGALDEEALERIQNYSNVESVVVEDAVVDSEEPAEEKTVDILLKDVSSAYEDLPRIASLAGLREEDITYHEELLNLYFVVNPDNPDSADAYAVLVVFAAAGVLSCFSLITIIRHAYAVYMNDKIHELGILASVGAAPGQLRKGLLKEAFALSALPAVSGILLGILGSAGLIAWTDAFADGVIEGRMEVPFSLHPAILVLAFAGTFVTVFLSAWMPARALSRLTPLEAVRGAAEKGLKRGKNARILKLLFGVEGELAGNALRAQRKALRMATLSLTLSFLAFGFVQCLFAVMTLNTDLTYFDAFRNSWDVMAVAKNTDIGELESTEALQSLPDVRDVMVYQKASAKRLVTEEELSHEFLEAGGFEGASERYVMETEAGWLVNAPVYILDDESFLEYCGHTGIEPSLDGAVILNQVRDDTDPNFRIRTFFPYLEEGQKTTVLRCSGNESAAAEIPVLGYAEELPVMQEEYQTLDYYEMIHVLPASLWAGIEEQIGGTEEDTSIRVLAGDNAGNAYTVIPEEEGPTLERLNRLEAEVVQAVGEGFEIETENRVEDKNASDAANDAIRAILGGFCILLAVIGVGNVFSNTLSFTWQRRREAARYLSVGMTPGQLWKMFCVEALVLAGRPVLISIPLLLACSMLFMRAAYLDPALLLPRAPVLPILAFALAIFGFVGLAYYLGGRRLMRMNLAEALRDETF